MSNNEQKRDELHEQLCAYVLGEGSPDERAQVEVALAASPELRAERERLEATIGLVQTSLVPATESVADQLSSAASAALMAAAEAKQPKPALPGPGSAGLGSTGSAGSAGRAWYSSPLLKVAAGISAVGLTFLAVQSTMSEGSDSSAFVYNVFGDEAPHASLSAKAERTAPEAFERLRALGYTDDASTPEAQLRELPEHMRSLGYSAGVDEPPEEELDAELVDLLGGLGYLDSGAKPSSTERKALLSRATAQGAQPGSTPSPARGLPVPQSEALAVDRQEAQKKGTYRGPGDTSPPSESRWKRGLATSGDELALGQPAAGAPVSLEMANELEGLGYLGAEVAKDEAVISPEVVDRLRALGYVSGDDDEDLDGADFFLDAPAEDRGDGDLRGDLDSLYELGDGERGRFELKRRLDFVLGSCNRQPNEKPRDMFFRFWGDNPFQYAVVDKLSTFSVDVDTASYTLARRYLSEGNMPEKAQIRTEEFVNYFDADVPAPDEGTFRIATELAPSRFGENTGDSWMLRVALRGKDVSREERQPLTLTFVIDVSGSMEGERLELVKHALRLLVGQLDGRDSIAVVAFSNEARVILPMTSAKHKALIETAIHQLNSGGGTNAEAGLRIGYELARAELTRNSHNRVVLLSDGVANIGQTTQNELSRSVDDARRAGVYLNTVGVGMGNHNDALLEQLADKGDGVCNYVDDAAEARRALVERFTGAFEPIARDVKIQVEFDPAQVQRYRLLGYENRAIADKDFRNDAVDAGEVNAGHQVVALYELSATPSTTADSPLATVRVRFKPPHAAGIAALGEGETDSATEIEQPVRFGDAAGSFEATSAGYRLSVLVGQFAEFLRRSQHARSDSLHELLAESQRLANEMNDGDVHEFVRLVERSRDLILAERARRDDLSRALDAIRHTSYLHSQLEDLNQQLGRGRLDGIEDSLRELSDRIDTLRMRIDGTDKFGLTRAELDAYRAHNARLAAQLEGLLRSLAKQSYKRR